MGNRTERVAHQDLVGGTQTALHSHAGGGGGNTLIHLVINGRTDANSTWTNMPAAVTFLFGSYRHVQPVDLSNCTQCRFIVNKQSTAGDVSSKLMLRYNTSFSTTVGNYSDIGTSEVSVAVNVTNTLLVTSWIDLVAGAKADVFVAVAGSGGNGILDPAFGVISAQFK